MEEIFRKYIIFLVCFSGVVMPCFAQQQKITLPIPIGGVVGGYVVHLPDDYITDPGKSYPLMIFLHGLSETGTGSQTDLNLITSNGPPNQIKNGTFPKSFTVAGETFKYIVISPQFNRRLPVITTEEFQSFLDYVLPLYRVDRSRIYLTGISIGGGLIWNYCGASANNAAGIAAVAIMAGSSKPSQERAFNMASQHLPVWAFHNIGDPSVPVSNTIGYVDTFNMYVPTPTPLAKKSLFNSNSHGVWYTGYSLNYREDGVNVYEWMLQYKREGQAPANVLPVAKAGDDSTIILPSSSIVLNGNNSYDPDGTIVKYYWQQVSGPGNAVIAKPNQAVSDISQLLNPGTYRFRLIVTDNSGGTSSDLIDIVMQPANNENPYADAGADQVLQLPQTSVILSAASSIDTDGTIATYQWQQLDAPRATVIQNPENEVTSVSGLTFPGVYIFRLTVVDNQGASSFDEVKITVLEDPNEQPVANAGAGIVIQQPISNASLSGAASYDTDGEIITYKWQFLDGPVTPVIVSPNSMNTSISGLTMDGIYRFELEATDDDGSMNTAITDIVVLPLSSNTPPVARTGADHIIQLPVTNSILSGTSSSDLDGMLVSFEWTQLSGPVNSVINSPTAAQTAVTGLTISGVYQYQLKVTDNNGSTAQDTMLITVLNSGNQKPVANAGSDLQVIIGNNLIINGSSSSDPDGFIKAYFWTKISGPSARLFDTWRSNLRVEQLASLGDYLFVLKVTDNSNAVDYDTVKVTVTDFIGGSIPPVANAGPNKTLQLPLMNSSLDGRASSDPDGSIVAYMWTQISGPVYSIINSPNSANTAISGLSTPGVYIYNLKVTDNNSISTNASTQITVLPALVVNSPPVSNPGLNQTIQLPLSTVTLSGAASTDSDGTISGYNWQQTGGPTDVVIQTPSSINTIVNGLLLPGMYTFQLRVTDNEGSSDQATMQVTVWPAQGSNQLPVAIAGSDIILTLPQSLALINGSASYDPDGNVKSYFWKRVSGPSARMFDTWRSTLRVEQMNNTGDYVFVLQVTDNQGAVGYDTVTIRIIGTQQSVVNNNRSSVIDQPVNSFDSFEWKIGPNPYRECLYIYIKSQKEEEAEIRLIQANGQVVASEGIRLTKGTQQIRIDTKSSSKGIYIVQLLFKSGAIKSTKVIKH